MPKRHRIELKIAFVETPVRPQAHKNFLRLIYPEFFAALDEAIEIARPTPEQEEAARAEAERQRRIASLKAELEQLEGSTA